MDKCSEESLRNTPFVTESKSNSAPDVKAMFGRIWTVAELLAEVDQQETPADRYDQVAEKHSTEISVYSVFRQTSRMKHGETQ